LIEPRRYFPAVAIGGGVAGVAMAIPVLGDLLRCCLCVGVMVGAGASMKIWLENHQAENLTPTDAAMLGACSGSVTAMVSWVLSVPLRLGFGDGLSTFYHSSTSLPDIVRTNLEALYAPGFGMIVMSLPIHLALYALMGAVGGFLALQMAFASRKSPA
jgi:hypothetical protein